MSERASHSAITTKQRLQLPLNGTLYTTTRLVSAEKPLPQVGGTMEAELGAFYAASRVIAVDRAPNQHDALVIQHVIIPSESEQLLSNWEDTTVDIGGMNYQAVVRTVILLATDYSSSTPAALSAMPIGSDNRFSGLGYVLWDRDCVKTGLPLEPVFRVDRRIYIIPQTVAGETFAPDGVLTSASGTVVADSTSADRGVNVIQSKVDPMGNGNASKVTDTAKKRTTSDSVATGWPQKQTKYLGIDADVPARYADQVLTVEHTEQVELAAGQVDDIPAPTSLPPNATQVVHEKINDWRYQKTTKSKQFSLSGEIDSTEIDLRPYVKITTRTTGGATAVVPGSGSGSSRLVFKAGGNRIYENSDQDSQARPGLKSIETNDQQWGSFKERTDYTTSSEPPEGGSSRLIFDDEETKIYESSYIQDIDANGTTKDKDPHPWGFVTWDGLYSLTQDGAADRSKQVWRRGQHKVFLNETLTTEVSGTTIDKEAEQWGTKVWSGRYATTQDSGAERSRQVWRIGNNYVFLNESLEIEISGGTVDIDPQSWGTLTWNGVYADSASGDRSRQVWRMGQYTVFLNESLSVEVEGTTKDLDPQAWGSIRWDGSYGLVPEGDRYRQVWKLKGNTVYLNETCVIDVSGTTIDKDPQPWGFAKWIGTYSTSEDAGADRSRQVWRLGDKSVYLNENVTVDVSGSTVDKDPQPWGTVQWDGTYATSITDGDRNRQVWRVGSQYVFLNEIASLSIDGTTLDKDLREWGELHWTGSYSDTTSGDRSRQVYNLHGKRVYLNEDVSVENVGGTNKEVLPQEWGSLTWSGIYQTVPDETPGHRSRQVFRVKNFTVFLNEEPSQQINTAEFVSAREENSLLIETQYSTYGTASNSGTNTRSRVVFALGNDRVYENIRIERTAKSARNYNGIATSVDLPPILRGINAGAFTRRDGEDDYWFQPNLSYGYRGSLPCKVTEYWSDTPEAAANVVIMKPEPVVFSFPGGGFSVPPSLHDTIDFQVNIGTDHPIYEQQVQTITIPATSPTSWQGQELLVDVDAQPYREGYVIREYRIQT